MKKNILLILVLFISFGSFAQKPKKIFSSLQEGNLQEAFLEYDKISSEKKYDIDEVIIFDLAKCLFLIEPSYPRYNPILSIKNFNGIFIPTDEQEGIIKFLSKYELNSEMISARIHAEILIEAKKLNTIESYSNALQVCSERYRLELLQLQEDAIYRKTILDKDIIVYKAFISSYPISKYKDEIQSLLERTVLDLAKKNQVVSELNSFMKEYSSSSLKQEATDFRDSIVLSKVPNEYDAMLAFTMEYPTSKYLNGIKNELPNLLYKEILQSDYNFNKCEVFIKQYPIDERTSILENILFEKVLLIDSIKTYQTYLQLFENGKCKNKILDNIITKFESLTRYEGLINNSDLISMELIKNGKELKGTYFYNKIGKIINIKGNFLENDSIILNENDSNNLIINQFRGKLISDDVFNGELVSFKNQTNQRFQFNKQKEGFANISFEKFHSVGKKNSSINLILLKIKTNNSYVDGQINNTIVNEITSNRYVSNISDYLASIKSLEFGEKEELTCDLYFNNFNICSIVIDLFLYDEGAARGHSSHSTFNFNLKNGEIINLEDILYPNYESQLNVVGKNMLLEQYENEGIDCTAFDCDAFELPKTYLITSEGLLFKFGEYSMIGPFRIDVLIPYNKIKGLIKLDGLLSKFIK